MSWLCDLGIHWFCERRTLTLCSVSHKMARFSCYPGIYMKKVRVCKNVPYCDLPHTPPEPPEPGMRRAFTSTARGAPRPSAPGQSGSRAPLPFTPAPNPSGSGRQRRAPFPQRCLRARLARTMRAREARVSAASPKTPPPA